MSNKPITRKEMFMAKASGQNVNTPEPITREEKFLDEIAKNGGGASEWADIGERTTYGDTLTWDGNTEGLVSCTSDTGNTFYKVSDLTPTPEEWSNGGAWIRNGNEIAFDGLSQPNDDIAKHGVGVFAIVYKANATDFDITFPEKGIYFTGSRETGVIEEGIRINGYTGFETTETVPLPNKYLDIIETVGGDTLTWDGDTSGLEFAKLDGTYWYRVSNKVLTQEDFANGATCTLKMSEGDMTTTNIIANDDGLICADNLFFIYVPSDGFAVYGAIFPTKGLYFPGNISGQIKISLTINGYTGFTKEQVKEEYLPLNTLYCDNTYLYHDSSLERKVSLSELKEMVQTTTRVYNVEEGEGCHNIIAYWLSGESGTVLVLDKDVTRKLLFTAEYVEPS